MRFSAIIFSASVMLFGGREVPAPQLFHPIASSRASAAAQMSMDMDALRSRFEVRLEDVQYTVDAPADGEMTQREDGFLRTFTIPGSSSTSFVTVHEGIVVGMIYAPEGAYLLQADGHEASVSRPEARVLNCAVESSAISLQGIKTEAVAVSPLRRRAVSPGNPPVTIRLLEVYTTDALAGAGSAQAMEAQIQAAVDQLNQIAKDSGVPNVNFVLAKAAPVNRVSNSYDDLRWVSLDSGVADLRKQYQGDLVVLWTDQGQDIAARPAADVEFVPEGGFSVVGRDGALIAYTHAHEIGHNLGMSHNIEAINPAQKDQFPFARGYQDPKVRRQTVMGVYVDPSGLYYTVIPRYSNPDLLYSDKFTSSFRTGTEMANNAWMLREKAALVSQYHLQLK